MKKISIMPVIPLISMLLFAIPIPIKQAFAADITKLYPQQNTLSVAGSTYYSFSTAVDESALVMTASLSYTSWKQFFKNGAPYTKANGLWDIPDGCTKIESSTWNISYYCKCETSVAAFWTAIDIKIMMSNGTTRETLASKVAQLGGYKHTSYQQKSTTYDFSEYEVVDDTDYLRIEYWSHGQSGYTGYNSFLQFEHAKTFIDNLTYTAGPSPKYYFNFNHTDIDDNTVDTRITWQLHNASGQVSYTEGEASLTAGAYTLKTYRHGILINETSLSTSTQGNSTVGIMLPMKAHSHTSNGYITSNATISSIAIDSQIAINLTFTISGYTPCLLIIDVGGSPTNVTKDGSPASYSYYTSPAKHVRISCSSLSTFSLTWDQPPEQEEGEIPSGVSGQNPWHKKLWVTVMYNDEKLHLANVSVINTATIWSLTNIFGEAKFRVPKGQYIVRAEHSDYGSAEKEVMLEDHMEIEIDIAKGSPLSIFPSFDFGDFEFGVLVLPLAIFVIYAFTLALKKPKRKYRYSYLR